MRQLAASTKAVERHPENELTLFQPSLLQKGGSTISRGSRARQKTGANVYLIEVILKLTKIIIIIGHENPSFHISVHLYYLILLNNNNGNISHKRSVPPSFSLSFHLYLYAGDQTQQRVFIEQHNLGASCGFQPREVGGGRLRKDFRRTLSRKVR